MATYRGCKERIDIAEKALTDVATDAAPRTANESAGERVLHPRSRSTSGSRDRSKERIRQHGR